MRRLALIVFALGCGPAPLADKEAPAFAADVAFASALEAQVLALLLAEMSTGLLSTDPPLEWAKNAKKYVTQAVTPAGCLTANEPIDRGPTAEVTYQFSGCDLSWGAKRLSGTVKVNHSATRSIVEGRVTVHGATLQLNDLVTTETKSDSTVTGPLGASLARVATVRWSANPAARCVFLRSTSNYEVAAGDNRFVNIDDLTTCASACPMKGAMTFLTPQRVTRSYSLSGPTASWSADGTTGAVELPCQ